MKNSRISLKHWLPACAAMCVLGFSTNLSFAQNVHAVAEQPGMLSEGGLLDSPDPDIVVTLRGGVAVGPAYLGSGETDLDPSGAIRFDYVRFPSGFEFGSGGAVGYRQGLGIRGSARYYGRRDSSEYEELTGLDDLERSFELGLGLGYEQRSYRVFADVRYGFIGHHAWTGEVGADGIVYPMDGLTVTLGPRVSLGDSRFSQTYFGVTDEEAARSGLAEFDPDGGIVGAGVVLEARYRLNDRWGVEGRAEYSRLLNDAAESPITEAGSENQYTFKLSLTRRISLDF